VVLLALIVFCPPFGGQTSRQRAAHWRQMRMETNEQRASLGMRRAFLGVSCYWLSLSLGALSRWLWSLDKS